MFSMCDLRQLELFPIWTVKYDVLQDGEVIVRFYQKGQECQRYVRRSNILDALTDINKHLSYNDLLV